MRERLGWITNCSQDESCPQNWLELSVSECPTSVACRVCGRTVELVLTEPEFNQKVSKGSLSAWPVVPCIGVSGAPRAATAAPSPHNGANHGAPVRPSASAPEEWFVRLQNGDSIKLDRDTMIVGRSRTCDVVIPSAKVSRQHASINRAGNDWFLEDLGSANGVWLNGEKITRVKINRGDVFTISDESLTFNVR